MQSTETGRTPHGPSPSVSFTHEDSNVFRFAIAVLSAFAVLATANAQYITTPGCPNGLCPRLQQAIPAAFPAQPLIPRRPTRIPKGIQPRVPERVPQTCHSASSGIA